MNIELIYDKDCPNVDLARTRLAQALTDAGLPGRWVEWDRADTAAPAYVRSYGSPSVLVNGRDVAGTAPSENMTCCRLYSDSSGGFTGAPPVEMIVTALRYQNG